MQSNMTVSEGKGKERINKNNKRDNNRTVQMIYFNVIKESNVY